MSHLRLVLNCHLFTDQILPQFLGRMRKLTTEILEPPKLLKALPAISKRGNDEVKKLVKNILDFAAANSKKQPSSRESSEAKGVDKASPQSKAGGPSSANGKASDTGTGTGVPSSKALEEKTKAASLKRPLSGESPSPQPNKRVQVEIPGPDNNTTSTTSSTVFKRPVMTMGSKSSASATASAAALKPKTTIGPAKSSAGAVSKKATTVATAAAVSGFSFGGMMEGILNPKTNDGQSKREEEEVPKETEEAKTKRLRKEARRKLRVSWKADHELVATKYFTHDPDEEIGHDASSMRDAGDLGTEGRMFKQLHKDHREIVDGADIDEDEDEEEGKKEEADEMFVGAEDQEPTIIDFSEVDEEERARNYSRFGGGKQEPDSADKKAQELREANTLMAVYITREDIPPRPSSPVEPFAGEDNNTPVEFGKPMEMTLSRLPPTGPKPKPKPSPARGATTTPVAAASLATAATNGKFNIHEILSVLGSTAEAPPPAVLQQAPAVQARAAAAAAPTPPVGQSTEDLLAALQRVSAGYGLQGGQAVQTPYTAEAAQPLTNNALLAGLFGGTAMAQLNTAPAAAAATTAAPTNSVSDILAALQFHSQAVPATQSTVQAAAAPAPPPPVAGLSLDFLAQLGIVAAPQQAQSYGGGGWGGNTTNGNESHFQPAPYEKKAPYDKAPYENPDRKRAREEPPNDGPKKGPWGRVVKPPKKPKFPDHDNPKKFSLPCRFWPEGKCRKGGDCTYRHDPL
jgi:hypothetical protein